jgi:hypothetical protein
MVEMYSTRVIRDFLYHRNAHAHELGTPPYRVLVAMCTYVQREWPEIVYCDSYDVILAGNQILTSDHKGW